MGAVKTLLLILVVTFLGITAAHAGAAEDEGTGKHGVALSPELEQRISAAARQVQTLHSDFVQEKYLSIFEETLRSSGRFYYQRPDKLRWELLQPIASGFVLNGAGGRRWHQRIAGSEPFKLEQDKGMALIAEQLFAWAKADLNWLRQHYKISVVQQKPVQLRLVPIAAKGGFLSHLLISFAADESHVSRVEIHESDGDYTRIDFNNTVVNDHIDSSYFADRLHK